MWKRESQEKGERQRAKEVWQGATKPWRHMWWGDEKRDPERHDQREKTPRWAFLQEEQEEYEVSLRARLVWLPRVGWLGSLALQSEGGS